MNILNLINRSLEVTEDVKNSDKIFIFNGLNATSETLIQNLLFRLENHDANAKIYIKQTENDTITNSDVLYSWYKDDFETSKALATSLKFVGAFSTTIEVLNYNQRYLSIANNHTSVVIIDTEGSLILDENEKVSQILLRDYFKFTSNKPKDIMLIQGLISEYDEFISVIKTNPNSINPSRLTGNIINQLQANNCKDYMIENLSNEYDRAYMAASKIMNILNNYITENMKLEYSKSVTNLNTFETNYTYFNKEIDLFVEFNAPSDLDSEYNKFINNYIKKRFLELKKINSDELNNLERSIYTRDETVRMLTLFIDDSFGCYNMIRYSYRGETYDNQSILNELYSSIRLVSIKAVRDPIVTESLSDEDAVAYNMVFYELLVDILGGHFKW